MPVYNNPEQVERCVKSMLGESEVCRAVLIFVIGWNGERYTSSTDWRVVTDKTVCVLPPAVVPQYQTFITVEAGMKIESQNGCWQIQRDEKTAEVVFPDGSCVDITSGKLEVEIKPGSKNFILSDCHITMEEQENKRVYRIIAGPETQLGNYENGQISLA